MPQAEIQRHVAAHGQPSDVGPGNVQMLHQAAQVLDRLILGVGGGVFGYVRRRVAAGGVGDDPEAPGEKVDLRVPTVVVAAELMAPN